ncbi:hypothetical protein EON63_15850 [archaeon]|nr:MAG: hypothetical protein EON63_15850 [archaeon]
MFKISFEDEKGEKVIPYQTSWGLTTRTLGVMVMVHGDDKGLVLPPRVSPIQIVLLPIAMKSVSYSELKGYCEDIRRTLKDLGVRCDLDERQNYTPGWKFNHWEQKGAFLCMSMGMNMSECVSVCVCV